MWLAATLLTRELYAGSDPALWNEALIEKATAGCEPSREFASGALFAYMRADAMHDADNARKWIHLAHGCLDHVEPIVRTGILAEGAYVLARYDGGGFEAARIMAGLPKNHLPAPSRLVIESVIEATVGDFPAARAKLAELEMYMTRHKRDPFVPHYRRALRTAADYIDERASARTNAGS
jgi:hypothetical protein